MIWGNRVRPVADLTVACALAGLLTAVAREKANVLHIYHDRNLGDLPVNTTAVGLELETRSHEHGVAVTAALVAEGFAVQPGFWM